MLMRTKVNMNFLLKTASKLNPIAVLQQLDLDAEWDPDQHDKQMADLYGNDVDAVVDEDKPTWEDDIDIGDIGSEQYPASVPNGIDGEKDQKKKKKKKKKKDENEVDEGGVDIDEMDADVVRDEEEEEWDGTEEMRKRKLKEYMDELDALDFNDMVRICAFSIFFSEIQTLF